ncbi:MAG TPA: YihY/virulence factor BrkB family protein [Gemmatimonadales bacterium]|nr:YihY/virulence factor BrkB family protein [Gemmatimonadales bacterium]
MTIPQFLTLLRKSAAAWNTDDASSMGAALAFYTLFSIAPLVVMVTAVASLILGPDAAQEHILGQLRALTGAAGAQAVAELLKSANSPAKNALTALVGTVVLLLGATSVFTELYGNLNRIWRNPSAPKASGILHLLRTRILSFGMILGIQFLLIVSLVVSAALAAAGAWWGARFTGWSLVGQVVNFSLSLAIYTVAFAMIYKYVPRAHITWHDVWIGAIVTAVLFETGKLVIGLVGMTGITSVFGAAGSLVVLLIWVYYSAQVFLLGAEFTRVYTYREGSRADEEPRAPPPQRQGRPLKAPPSAKSRPG